MANIDWEALQDAALTYRHSKGFVAIDWANAAPRLCCVMKEIVEVEGALTNYNITPDGHVPEALMNCFRELADVTLYILTIQADLKIPAGTARLAVHVPKRRLASPGELTAWMRYYWGQAFEAWQKGNQKDFTVSLDMLLAHVVALHDQLFNGSSRSLETSCLLKLREMVNRTPLHGGKDPRT